MPTKDLYHDIVVRALASSGWIVSQEQTTLRIGKRRLWVDVLAIRYTDNSPILVEIKVFERVRSYVYYLSNTCGQYGLYQGILDDRKITIPLYLAIPLSAFNGIFKEPIGQVAIKHFGIRLIVFEPVNAEIIQWIP